MATLPRPWSLWASHVASCSPARIRSWKTRAWYVFDVTPLAHKITGMPRASARFTGPARAAFPMGVSTMASGCWAIASAMSLICLSALACESKYRSWRISAACARAVARAIASNCVAQPFVGPCDRSAMVKDRFLLTEAAAVLPRWAVSAAASASSASREATLGRGHRGVFALCVLIGLIVVSPCLLLLLHVTQSIESDSTDDDHPLDHQLQLPVQPGEQQHVEQDREKEDARNGPHDTSTSSDEAGATDHGGRDRIKLEACPQVAIDVADISAEHEPTDSRASTAQEIGRQHDTVDRDTGHARSFPVDAGGIDLASIRRPIERHPYE